MSDASPTIFKRKSKPSRRQRDKSPDDTEQPPELVGDSGRDSPITLATKLKIKAKRAQPKSRLSFGADDEGSEDHVFQLKKSSLSRKIALGTHPAVSGNGLPTNLDQASISARSNGGPMYDDAYLSELKASTPSSRPPLPTPVFDPYNGDVSMDVSMDVSDMSMQSMDVYDASDISILPEASIRSAKEKRKHLRTIGVDTQDEYVSLTVAKQGDEFKGPHPESRLMREEDEVGDGDDEFAEYTGAQERIALGKKPRKAEAIKRKEAIGEMIVDAEEDEDSKQWDEEQERRGIHRLEVSVAAPVKQVYRAAPVPPAIHVPALGPAIARLSQTLTALTTSHATNSHSLSTLGEERARNDEREAELRKMIALAEEKRSWFAAFREWVENVATFLDEKFPALEKLENEHISILKERSDMVLRRRQADDEDDLSNFLGTLPVAAQPEPEQLDELGRVVPQTNPAAARRDRRSARNARRTYRRGRSQASQGEEGYSTDNSLPPSDAADYATAMRTLTADGEAILSDVRSEDFNDPSLGLGKWFSEWRSRFGESYTGAWGGLGLVGAWEFWVRMELLGWNPLEDERSLDSFPWVSSLYDYSRPSLSGQDEPDLGPDGDLVSAMISTAVIPRLCSLVDAGAFDPYSAQAIRRMVDLAEQIEASVGEHSLKFQMLLKSIYTRFQTAVSQSTDLARPYLELNKPGFDPKGIPARQRFLARRIKLAQNIVRWRKYTGERFGIGELATKLVESVIPVAESGWEVGGKESLHKLVTLLPPELVPVRIKSGT